ncbi:hypothetical protein PENSUB_13263 [Penicillium subrubescens]|uniref:Uncharacterized protein n=1 Tax=Penicillium subrubescens TaxID=1316194 RepID=A0A1Q5SRJ2_9EURO|nr:hypothetical protein PENSUB_13263 [Penicillium subrubescens]
MAQAYRDPIESARLRERDGITKDEEKSHIENSGHQYEDPFGNEEFAEVKYRTLYWCHDRRNHLVGNPVATLCCGDYRTGPVSVKPFKE